MNRRNVLLGLGTVVTGGGAALGTGAFSSVEADRDATFSVVNDDSALLTLTGDGTYVTGESSGAISFSFTELNDNAKTIFEGVLTIENNTQDAASKDVYIKNNGNVDGTVIDFQDSADTEGSIVGTGNAVTLSDTGTITLDIEIDTREGDPSSVDTITVVAEDNN